MLQQRVFAALIGSSVSRNGFFQLSKRFRVSIPVVRPPMCSADPLSSLPFPQRARPLRQRAVENREGVETGSASTGPVFDFSLAVGLAGASFDAYAEVETRGLTQTSPPGGQGHVETTYTSEEFLQSIMAGLLKISVLDATVDVPTEKNWFSNGNDVSDLEFEVSISGDSWAVLKADSKADFLFIKDPKKQWMSIKCSGIDSGDDNKAYAMVLLDDLAINDQENGLDSHDAAARRSVTKSVVLKSDDVEVGSLRIAMELLPFTDENIVHEVSQSEMAGQENVLLSRPGPGLMTEEWKELIKTVQSVRDATYEPVAFIENEDTDTQVWLFWNKKLKLLIVAFRGTEHNRWRDILTDISLTPMPLDADRMSEIPRTMHLIDVSSEPGTLSTMLGKIERAKKETDLLMRRTGDADDAEMDDHQEPTNAEDESEEEHNEVFGEAKSKVLAAVNTVKTTAEDLHDTLTRIKLVIQEEEGGKASHQGSWIHSGFLTAYDSVRTQTLGLIEAVLATDSTTGLDTEAKDSENDSSDKWTVAFTGHSLGGALATLAAFDIGCRYPEGLVNLKMYNFGSPRVGNGHFAKEFDKKVPDAWRIVNRNDAVATIPRLMGYHHVGHYVSVNQHGECVIQHSKRFPFEGTSLEEIMPAIGTAFNDAVVSVVPDVLQNATGESSREADAPTEVAEAKERRRPYDDEEDSSDDSWSDEEEALTPEELEKLWEYEQDAWSMLLRGDAMSEHMEEQYFSGKERRI